MSEKYEVLEWSTGNDLKLRQHTKHLMTISYNLCQVYLLEDKSYLVMPINPFAKCLVTNDRSMLDKWISESHFPSDEKSDKIYFKDVDQKRNLLRFKIDLENELFTYIATIKSVESNEQIDNIYKLLKAKRKFTKYKLHFILLVGEYLMKKFPNEDVSWGLSRNKQLLNPFTELVLIKDIEGDTRYFSLEDGIAGKWGFTSMQSIETSFKRYWFKPNEIVTIEKIK